MAVHQLLSHARLGDAVTHQAIALRAALGAGSQLLAHRSDDSVAGTVVPLDDVIADEAGAGVAPDDTVAYHVTIGCEPAVCWLTGRRGPYALVHHNITPHGFFEGLSWDHARLAEQGRDELARLVPGAAAIVADSEFNAAEIRALGGTVSLVHPPLDTTARLSAPPDDRRLARALRRRDGPTFLHIGQRAPHKRPEQLVFAVHLLELLGLRARLTLVGAEPVPAYAEAVDGTAARLLGSRYEATGLVSDVELATRLRHATALVTTSVHEGFCVPVVEAMAAGTPVVATAAGAVPETTDGAALLLPPEAPPTVLAEALHAVATDDGLAAELRERGLRRAAELERRIDLPSVARVLRSGRPA